MKKGFDADKAMAELRLEYAQMMDAMKITSPDAGRSTKGSVDPDERNLVYSVHVYCVSNYAATGLMPTQKEIETLFSLTKGATNRIFTAMVRQKLIGKNGIGNLVPIGSANQDDAQAIIAELTPEVYERINGYPDRELIFRMVTFISKSKWILKGL